MEDESIQQLAEAYGVTPEEARLIAYQVLYGEEAGALDRRMSRADALRDTRTPQGRQAGGVYVAANPLEHLGAGLQRYGGQRQAKQIEGEQAAAREKLGRSLIAGARAEQSLSEKAMDDYWRMLMWQDRRPDLQGPPVPPPAAQAPMQSQPQPQPQPQAMQPSGPGILRRPMPPMVQSFSDAVRTAPRNEAPQGYGVGFRPGGSKADEWARGLREWGANFPRPWENNTGRNVGGLRLRPYGG